MRFRWILNITLPILYLLLLLSPLLLAQEGDRNERIIQRYKQILHRKPKEGNAFDRLYQFYLEGPGLDQMVADYQAEARENPNDPSIRLILGHIYKRLGKDREAIQAYKRGVELAPDNYYAHFALGRMYAALRRYQEAIEPLKQAAALAERSRSATPEELTAIYKSLGRAYYNRDRLEEAIAAWNKIAEIDPTNIFARIELADLFREQKLYPQAIAQHEAIIRLKKSDPYRVCLSLREIGKLQEEMGEYEVAIESYDRALALMAPGNWLRRDIQRRIAKIFIHNGDWDGLIEYYRAKLKETPNEVELIGLLGDAYIENEKIEDGIVQYRRGLELAPTDTGLRLKLIAALRNLKRFEEAAAEYERLIKGQPDEIGNYRELGEIYMKMGLPDKARETYRRMIERQPDDAASHLMLAEIYAGHEWVEDAIAEYERAIQLAPGNLDYIVYLGEFHLRQGNRQRAIETWNRMVEGEKGTAANYSRLAQLLESKEFRAEAIAAARKAVELAPKEYRYREQLAGMLMEAGEYEAALKEYRKAIDLAPNDFFAERMEDQIIEIHRRQGTLERRIAELEAQPVSFDRQKRLAKMYMKLGNMTRAVEILENARGMKPEDVDLLRRLAEIYSRQGRLDRAAATYKHLAEIDRGNAREYYSYIAKLYLRTADFESAMEMARQVIAHSPRNPEGYQLAAEIAEQKGEYEEAIDELKQAIRLRPESTEIRAKLAETYVKVGDYRQAIEQYWRCWELSDSVSDKLVFINPLSDAYYDMGRGGELEEKLREMAKANPSDIAPVLALAELYRIQGDLLAAREQLAHALDRKPNDPDLLGQLVDICLNLADMGGALEYQRRLVKVEPDIRNQQRLGELLFDAGREQEAVQVWTRLLHAKHKSLEAEVRLATLLIRHSALDEALAALNRAEEMATDAATLYQIGAAFAELNEPDRAIRVFHKILDMPKPAVTSKKPSSTPRPLYYGVLAPADANRFLMPRNLAYQIRGRYGVQTGQPWTPGNFEEAQAGALVQIVMISALQGKLNELIAQLETEHRENPKDLKPLEKLAQIYILIEDADRTLEIVKRMAALSPDDPTYQYLLFTFSLRKSDYETVEKAIDKLSEVAPETWLSSLTWYANWLERRGMREKSRRMLSKIEVVKVKSPYSGLMLVESLVRMGEVELAKKVLDQIPLPSTQTKGVGMSGYLNACGNLVSAYVREGEVKRAVELFWEFLERTKPDLAIVPRMVSLPYSQISYGGYRPVYAGFPFPNIYYNDDRKRFLEGFFVQLWIRDRLEPLYAKFQAEFERARGRDRILPGLALSYFYWWEGRRGRAQEILATLQRENPDDLILKFSTALVSINSGKHKEAMDLLTQIAEEDPRHRGQYYDLILQLAIYMGNTVKVRELLTKILNSPASDRELYQFSQKLQQGGLTQYAIAAAKKAMKLAMWKGDPNFMMELGRHLEQLGRGQDAAILAERAMRLVSRRSPYGWAMSSYYLSQASNLIRGTRASKEKEARLIEAAERNPNSFRAQIDLATYYESLRQFDKASKYFKRALALRPNDIGTRTRYAQMLSQSGRLADAVEQYTVLLKEHPNALGYSYWEVVDLFFRANKVDELVSLVKEIARPSVGVNFSLYFAREAANRCLQDRPKAAVEIYERLIEVNPNDTYMYQQLASAYAASGEREKAIRFIREKLESDNPAIAQNPYTRSRLTMELMELYRTSGDIATLAEEYEGKLASNPDDEFLNYLVAMMRIDVGDLEGADALVEKLMSGTVLVNTNWLLSLADAYRKAGDRKREIKLLERAAGNGFYGPYEITQIYEKLGAAYVQNGDKGRAKEVFRKMASIRLMQRTNPWEKRSLADLFMQNEMWDEAKAIYTELMNDPAADRYFRDHARRQLVEIEKRISGLSVTTRFEEKTSEMNIGVKRSLAQQYMQRNELDRAKKLLMQIIKEVPEDYESQRMLAQIYSRQGEHDKAIAQWKSLLKVDPENTQYQDGLIDAYRSAGKADEALKLAEGYLQESPDSFNYARLARLYASFDRIEEAIEAYRKSIQLNPGDQRVHQELARLYMRKGDLESAESSFKEALKYTGQDWQRREIQRQIMEIYRRQGKLEEMFRKAEEEGRMTSDMWQERARYYLSMGELEKAADSYKKAMDMTTQSWNRGNIANELIGIYVRLGRDEEAIRLYEELSRSTARFTSISISSAGVKVQTGGERARETIINAYKDRGKLGELLERFREKLKEKPETPSALEMIAEIHRIRGEHAEAAEAYQALCELEPTNVPALYRAAVELNRSGRSDRALEILNKAKAALSASGRGRDFYLLGALGYICLNGKMYDAAVELFEDAIAQSGPYTGSGRTAIYRGLAQSYLGAKRYEEAIRTYQQMANIAQTESERREAEQAIRKAYKEGGLYDRLIAERLQAVKDRPDDPDAFYALGQTYEWNDMHDEAIAAYKRADELNPNNKIILESLARVYLARGRDEDVREAKGIYRRLIELTDTTGDRIQKRNALIDLYRRSGEIESAITELRNAITSSSNPSERNAALKGLWKLYVEYKRENEGIAVLEELEPQMEGNSAFYELLGDAYRKVGAQEKANAAYAKWVELRQMEVNRSGSAWGYDYLAQQILDKGIMPQKALELAERAYNLNLSFYYSPLTLGRAYLANGEYEKAIEKLKQGLSRPGISVESYVRGMWSEVIKAGRNLKDDQRFAQLVIDLAKIVPDDKNSRLYTDIALAGFYRHRGDEEKAKEHMNRTGFIMEDAWWIIGPFDNTSGEGYERVYVPEGATQIDLETEYPGRDGVVRWRRVQDEVFDGFIDFDEIFGGEIDWALAYAFTTITSPEERDVLMRIGSDDQIKVWLNGEQVFTYSQTRPAAIDQDTVQVTLKPGRNTILIKLCEEGGDWGFYLRFTDTDGNPLPVN